MNSKYLVDTTTHEYLCIALKKGLDWVPNNQDRLTDFMSTRTPVIDSNSVLVAGEFNDNVFSKNGSGTVLMSCSSTKNKSILPCFNY
ncbi:hypothetical protein [Pontibacter sp. Tf4]|uniref:hypothetical protein n=1 Tax=Pontibacter sp. Tf4 TaxID=2761620 RepID=UPI00210508BD|nr:hypothetical protein [Pontibacter sp. Tf4]